MWGGTYSVKSIRRNSLNHWATRLVFPNGFNCIGATTPFYLKTEEDIASVTFSFIKLDDGQKTETQQCQMSGLTIVVI